GPARLVIVGGLAASRRPVALIAPGRRCGSGGSGGLGAPGRLHGSRMRRVLVGERPQVRLGVVGGAGRARRRGAAIRLRRGPAGGGAGRAGELVGASAGGWEGGWAAEGPEPARVPAGSVLLSVGAPIQGRRRDVSPKAASRFRRAASGASWSGPGRWDASMY